MKSFPVRFIGQDYILLDFCRQYLKKSDFIKCHPIISTEDLFNLQQQYMDKVIFVDLPAQSQLIYEFGIRIKRIFPKAQVYAFGHREDVDKILKLQHINKLFHYVIPRCNDTSCIDKILTQIKSNHQLNSTKLDYVDFTSSEKKIISLTCEERNNREIAQKLKISVRTVETHKSNIYSKLGSKHPHRMFRYATNYNLD